MQREMRYSPESLALKISGILNPFIKAATDQVDYAERVDAVIGCLHACLSVAMMQASGPQLPEDQHREVLGKVAQDLSLYINEQLKTLYECDKQLN